MGDRGVQRVRNEEQVNQARRRCGRLPPVHGLVVAADALAQLHLRQASVSPGYADALPDNPGMGEGPLGWGVGWHPSHAGVILNGSLYQRR